MSGLALLLRPLAGRLAEPAASAAWGWATYAAARSASSRAGPGRRGIERSRAGGGTRADAPAGLARPTVRATRDRGAA